MKPVTSEAEVTGFFVLTLARFQFVEPGIRAHGVEHLSGIGNISDQLIYPKVVERYEVYVQYAMPLVEKIKNYVLSSFSRATSEEYSFLGHVAFYFIVW
jgi:hypothetical protein